MYNKLMFFVCSLLLFACNSPKKGEGKVIVVFCDVTKSLNAKGVDKVIDNASKILKGNRYAEIYFFPVDSSTNNPLLEKATWKNLGINDVEYNEKKMVDSLSQIIKQRYQTSNARATCLLKCFETAYEIFKRKDATQTSLYLYFLSDMLEHCDSSGELVSLEKKDKVGPAMSFVKNNYKPIHNFKEKGVQVAFVITPTHQIPIDEQDRKAFWRDVCLKYGYSAEDFDAFPFSTLVPDNY